MPTATKLTNLQLELLKYFEYELDENELLEVKRVLAKHFATKAMNRMDELWEERGWTQKTVDQWLQED